MRQFFKFVFATITGLLLFFVVIFVFLLVIGLASGGEKPTALKDNSVLKISFDQPITERSSENPFEDFPIPVGSQSPSSIGLIDLKEALANAALDDKIKGVYLEMGFLSGGYASVEEIRDALIEFKKSKKFVWSYGNFYTEKAYYLASVADAIYVNPTGIIEFDGYSANYTFFKNALEKLEVKPEIFKVGDFKSAVEPFLRENMSEASKLQTSSFLNSIKNHNWQKIAQARNLTLEELTKIADSVLIREGKDALTYKLATHVGYADEFGADLRKKLGITKEKDKINFVTLGKYLKAEKKIKVSNSKNKIAVVIASGDIGGEKTNENETIGDNLAEEIKKARLDESVKAVVLRINSGGGSVFTSDVIWREVELTKKSKPIVASFSDVAASGGYYIAMGCDTIVAHPNTITGSIGVFALTFDIEPMLRNKLGITIDGVETNAHADPGSRPFDNFERNVIQKGVEKTYDEFTSKVAQGRKTTQEEIKKIASGRVWSGVEAKERNLIDVHGGLEDAIKIAGKLAKLKENDYKLRYLPAKKDFWQEFSSGFNKENEEKMFAKQFGELAPYVKKIKSLEKLKGIQLRMPFELEIK
ncbi:MAG: signal peptide peptidase SppA [Verrucomicrobia bacterium]|nr:signal peptide peptidase SppA [Cytophagales bacterium]